MRNEFGRLQTPGYTPVARWLHWITAVLVLMMIPVGIYIGRAENVPDVLYDLHKSIGVLLLLLVLFRLIYRLSNPPPPLSEDIPPVQRLAAHVNHWGLYVLLIVQPLVGWIATSAYRAPVPFFGLFELPPIWREDRAFSDQMYGLHFYVGLLIAVFAIGHIGAALYHHFVRKDDVLLRMVRS